MTKPKKWTEVYPYGTKAGDDEAKFFKFLARNPKYDYRSTAAIVKGTNLPRQRVEEIIDKYVNKVKPPILYAHPTNDDHWGYWERCTDRLDTDKRDISKKDKDSRVDKHLAGTPSMVGSAGIDDATLKSICDSVLTDVARDRADLETKFAELQALRAKVLTDNPELAGQKPVKAILTEADLLDTFGVSDGEYFKNKLMTAMHCPQESFVVRVPDDNEGWNLDM